MYKMIPISQDGTLSSIAKTAPADVYKEAIARIVDDIANELGHEEVRSIVLRGSIACHTDIPGISDLDMVIFTRHYSEEVIEKLITLAAKETAQWKSLVSLVDLSCERFELLTADIHHNRLYLNLKLTGITIWGEDIIASLPPIKHNSLLAARIARQTWLESLQTHKLICEETNVSFMGEVRGCDFLCVWFMRSFCRGLIAPVMLKQKVFSLHVQSCVRIFGDVFPEYASIAERCRELECSPTTDWNVLKKITSECLGLYHKLCEQFPLEEDINESLRS